MVRFTIISCLFLCCGIVGAVADTDATDALIIRLTEQRDALRAELDACQKNTRGYKIAGITTLAATAGGVYGNIKLHEAIDSASGYGGGGLAKMSEDTCAADPICNWERQCKLQNYPVKNCDHDKDCCAASGCPCYK